MRAIAKARAWADGVRGRTHGVRVPPAFRPPYGGASYFGQSYRWEQVLHFKYWSFVAIRAIMREIAGGKPPNLGRKKKRVVGQKSFGPSAGEEFEPYPNDHPLQRVFCNPNGPDVAYDLWAFHVLFKCLTGQSHWWVMKNAFGTPVEIWQMPTHWMRLLTDRDGQPCAYVLQSPWGHQTLVPYEDVVSFYDHSPLNRYEGYAVSQAVGEWIDVYEAKTRTQLATFKNGAVPSFHVSLGDSYADPDEQMLERFYAKWFARFQGEDNAGKPLITGADIEVKDFGHQPVEVLEASLRTEEQIRDMTLAAYGVPKGVLGLEPTSDTSAYAPLNQFVRFTIQPELTYTGQVVTEKIVKSIDPEGVCYWDDRVVSDPELLERQLAADIADGTLTPNEKRAMRGREPYEHGGDDPLLNGSPVPWATGQRDGMDVALERALSAMGGGSGGYLLDGVANGRTYER